MAQPKLLLLGETTLGLALIVVKLIFETISQLREKRLFIILAEQDSSQTFAIAHRVYVLENDQIASSGDGTELLSDPRIRSAYLELRGFTKTMRRLHFLQASECIEIARRRRCGGRSRVLA